MSHPFESIYILLQDIKIQLGFKKLKIEDVRFLESHFIYFKNLRVEHRKDFKKRLIYFMAEKRFIPRGELKQVTREMQLLISATAVMVSFGFRNVTLKHFKKILIYPDNYYSTINQQYHQGEVNPKFGIIVLSWRSFVKGIENADDGVNLGVHEMAHALKLENQIHYNHESNFFNPRRWINYSNLAQREIIKMRKGEVNFLRDSAAKNTHEFFAVALEAFFEKSREFKTHNPEMYESLVFLLKQDPMIMNLRG